MKKQYDDMVETIKNGVLAKFPLLGATMSDLKIEEDFQMPTAATDGSKIYFNPDFINSLSYKEKVFVFSHEIMHVAFDHIMRSGDKEGQLWNIATDSVINQLLKKADLPIPEGGIDMEDAFGKSAEEMYTKLKNNKKQQEEKDFQSGNEQESSGKDDKNQSQSQNQGQTGGNGRHNIWEQTVKNAKTKQGQSQCGHGQMQQGSMQQGNGKEQGDASQLEKQFSEENEQLKRQMAKQIKQQIQKEAQTGHDNGKFGFSFGAVGNAKSVISWKKILKRELEKEEDRWTYRRADEENDFSARIGEMEVHEHPETEVMLDVSGSIDDDFLKAFLRQLKPLLKQSKIKVGFFADWATKEFKEIKSAKDIDELRITRPGCGTNMDAAARAFSKSKHINKIVFTDGETWRDSMPKEDLKDQKILWIVYGNKDFKPCCGRVIFVSEHDLKNIQSFKNDKQDDFSM